MIKLLIVDDHDMFRHALRRTFEDVADMQVVGQVDRGELAWEFVRQKRVDNVLMDFGMQLDEKCDGPGDRLDGEMY